jgi:hypothetical protein
MAAPVAARNFHAVDAARPGDGAIDLSSAVKKREYAPFCRSRPAWCRMMETPFARSTAIT